MNWTNDRLLKLYSLVNPKNPRYERAAIQLGITTGACQRRYERTDWATILGKREKPKALRKVWTPEERLMAYTMRTGENPLSYLEIAERLGRTPVSVERMYQTTNWKQFLVQQSSQDGSLLPVAKNEILQRMVQGLILISRHSLTKMEEITEKEFMGKMHFVRGDVPVDFETLREMASKELEAMGAKYPETIQLGAGTYLIVGDSHGKETKRSMFNLLEVVCKHLNVKNIIHIGHALDDASDMSYLWENFDNLIILAKAEELEILTEIASAHDIVRNKVYLGNLTVSNQDLIQDYALSFVGSISRSHFPGSAVVNLHRMELDTRTTSGERCQIAGAGCLCEPHIVSTVKSINFTGGERVKLSWPTSYGKYRRQDHFNKLWEQGMIVVHVDKQGRFNMHPCRIKRTAKGGFTTSYFDTILTEHGVVRPDRKTFFNGDAHCDKHDVNVLDIQEQFCQDYKPDDMVNLGDVMNNKSFNHHIMERTGNGAIESNALDEMAQGHYVLARQSKWAKNSFLLTGNHERFAMDFVEKFPQFRELFNLRFMVNLDALGFNLTAYKRQLMIDKLRFVHGDIKMYGARGGQKLDKIHHTFGTNTVIGDVHYPSIRMGCYSVGLTGKLDQEYNEPDASRWMHGFGYCNHYDGEVFISLVNIRDYSCFINGKNYQPKGNWDLPAYEAAIQFRFQGETLPQKGVREISKASQQKTTPTMDWELPDIKL